MATFAVVGLPALVASMLGLPAVLSLVLAVVLSIAASTAGAALWMRRPGSRELVFGDLMVWGWLRRVRAERRLARMADLLGRSRMSGDRHVEVLEQLAAGLEARDAYTHGHSKRVARHAEMIARRMALPAGDVAKIRTAAAVHDVGKINTPRAILTKPGRLDGHELAVMQRHAQEGAEMVAGGGDPDITEMVRRHHERLDGTGYPDGLTEPDIALGARIIAVADTFDAMTSTRPYRAGLSHKRALDVLLADAGTKLDARAVGAFRSYYAGRGMVASSALLVTGPQRFLSWLGGALQGEGAVPLAQGLSALGAAALLGGSMVGPSQADRQPPDRREVAAVSTAPGPESGSTAPRRDPAGRDGASGGGQGDSPRSRYRSRSRPGAPEVGDRFPGSPQAPSAGEPGGQGPGGGQGSPERPGRGGGGAPQAPGANADVELTLDPPALPGDGLDPNVDLNVRVDAPPLGVPRLNDAVDLDVLPLLRR